MYIADNDSSSNATPFSITRSGNDIVFARFYPYRHINIDQSGIVNIGYPIPFNTGAPLTVGGYMTGALVLHVSTSAPVAALDVRVGNSICVPIIVYNTSISSGYSMFEVTGNGIVYAEGLQVTSDAKEAYICIFDMQGKMLQKKQVYAGENSLFIDGSTLGEGMYLYSLIVDGQIIDTKRMILTK